MKIPSDTIMKINGLIQSVNEKAVRVGIEMAANNPEYYDFVTVWTLLLEGLGEFEPYDPGTGSVLAQGGIVRVKVIPFFEVGFDGGAFFYVTIFDIVERASLHEKTSPEAILEEVRTNRDFIRRFYKRLSIDMPFVNPFK